MPLLAIGYFVLGLLQLAAYFEGIEIWLGFGFVIALISFIVLAAIPLGSIATAAIAFYGCYRGWHWPWWQAALLTFPFPIFALAFLAIQGSANVFSGARRGAD